MVCPSKEAATKVIKRKAQLLANTDIHMSWWRFVATSVATNRPDRNQQIAQEVDKWAQRVKAASGSEAAQGTTSNDAPASETIPNSDTPATPAKEAAQSINLYDDVFDDSSDMEGVVALTNPKRRREVDATPAQNPTASNDVELPSTSAQGSMNLENDTMEDTTASATKRLKDSSGAASQTLTPRLEGAESGCDRDS